MTDSSKTPSQSALLRHQRLELTPISKLKPHPANPRRHSAAQIRQIAASIRAHGWTAPIVCDEHWRIIAGHGRFEAAKTLKSDVVPTIMLSGLSDEELRALMIADNKLCLNGTWDDHALVLNFKDLEAAGIDLSLTGFAMPEIDQLIVGAEVSVDQRANAVPATDADATAVSRLGDTWILGRHRLHCGDATAAADHAALMQGARARMALSDPPFNVRVNGHARGNGADRHREFAMASGEMSEGEYVTFLKSSLGRFKDSCLDGALSYIFIDWAHVYELLHAAREIFGAPKNICVWNKSNGGMGSLYRSKHELIAIFKSGRAPHINNIELGRHGRYRTNVWDYAGVNSFGTARSEELAMHPTVKPVELIADAILDASRRGDIVLDPFAGSGTIIIAAERVGRRAYAMEIDPLYVDTTIRRYQVYTCDQALHEGTGLTFDALARRRAKGAAMPQPAQRKPRGR